MIDSKSLTSSRRKTALLLIAATTALGLAGFAVTRVRAQEDITADDIAEQDRLIAVAEDLFTQGKLAEAERSFARALATINSEIDSAAFAENVQAQVAFRRNARRCLDRYLSCLVARDGSANDAYLAVLASKDAAFFRERAARRGADAASRTAVGVPFAQLAAALPPDAALVDYFEFTRGTERTLLAFVLRSAGSNSLDTAVQMFQLGPAEPLTAAIDRWRTTYGMSAESREAGALLRTKLWQPLTAAVGDATLVLISPDGALARFPFAALPGAKPDTYLIEDVSVALVPVPLLIPAIVAAARMDKLAADLLVLGGVDYDHREEGAASSDDAAADDGPLRPWEQPGVDPVLRAGRRDLPFSFLPATESEAAFVAELYRRAMQLSAGSDRIIQLSGAAATEEAFTRLAPTAYLLHLATHSFLDEPPADADATSVDPGQYAGLVFAGANNPPETPADAAPLEGAPNDGFLTAAEIAALPLDGAQLVVISACDESVGQSVGGEDLLTIQRAFQLAGARTTVAALWPVNDEATRRIMEEFYRNYLEKQMSPLAALRAAQLWALKNPNTIPAGAQLPDDQAAAQRLPPQFWAAFTLSGDWR